MQAIGHNHFASVLHDALSRPANSPVFLERDKYAYILVQRVSVQLGHVEILVRRRQQRVTHGSGQLRAVMYAAWMQTVLIHRTLADCSRRDVFQHGWLRGRLLTAKVEDKHGSDEQQRDHE